MASRGGCAGPGRGRQRWPCQGAGKPQWVWVGCSTAVARCGRSTGRRGSFLCDSGGSGVGVQRHTMPVTTPAHMQQRCLASYWDARPPHLHRLRCSPPQLLPSSGTGPPLKSAATCSGTPEKKLAVRGCPACWGGGAPGCDAVACHGECATGQACHLGS